MRYWTLVLMSLAVLSNGCGPAKKAHGSAQPLRIYSFSEVDQQWASAPRPIVVFLYTDWCAYCQHMKVTTLQDDAVKAILNQSYYYIAMNGESKEAVQFRNTWYYFQPDRKVHALAAALGQTDVGLVFPTIVLLNTQLEIVFQHVGYLSSDELLTVLEQAQ